MTRASSADRVVYEAVGLTPAFFVLTLMSVVLYALAVKYVWLPTAPGFFLALLGLLAAFIETSIPALIGLNDPSVVKEAFVASRTARGLPVRPDVLRAIDRPGIHTFTILASFAFACLVATLLYFSVARPRRALERAERRG